MARSSEQRVWIAPPQWDVEENPRPTWWIRQTFTVEKVADQVAVEVVCLGYYELYVNGQKVSEEPLAPSISKLDKRALALSHDIASFLREGENCIGIWCSSGWYLPHQVTVHDEATPLLGISVAEDLSVSGDWVCRRSNRSTTGLWRWNNFGGEEVDAREALPEWCQAECDVSDWVPVRAMQAPPIEVVERTCPPNRIGEIYSARSFRQLEDGRYEVDFGICLNGWVDVPLEQLGEGQTVTLRFYDLPADNDRENDHSYNQFSVYHAKGDGNDRFANKFNYAGFRYMTIEGLASEPDLSGMRAMMVESAMETVGHFRCSNELYNKIHDMNLQTLRCLNLGGYSVDCPHRERYGYGADGQTAVPGYLYLLDSRTFLRKWLTDWCDVYEPDTGRISLCAPTVHGEHAPPWGGIVATLAWDLYVYFGDRSALEEAFPVILDHLRWLQKSVSGGVIRKDLLGSAFHADWVPAGRGMDSGNTPETPMRELFNTCYLIYLWRLHLKICDVLGTEDGVTEALSNIDAMINGVNGEFYDEEQGLYLMPEQAYQAMPLLAGAVPAEREDAIRQKLLELIRDRGWHFDTGLPGTKLLLDLLMDLGEHEVIGKVYAQDTYPGWGYMIAQGATTIWEQWNGFWSQIHSCFAGPAAWFYQGLAGIRPDEDHPGFKKFMLSPAFLKDIDFVEAEYDSPAGKIVSSWRREGGKVTWKVEVPEGTSAVIGLPKNDVSELRIDGAAVTEPGKLELSSGCYELGWREAGAR